FDTTSVSISNMLLILYRQPGLKAKLMADRDLLPAAINEFLRFQPASPSAARYAAKDVEIGGAKVKAGDTLMVSWAAANRDPEAFPRPTEIDLDRPATPAPIPFGTGMRTCLGKHLAQMELRILLDVWLSRIPEYDIQADAIVPSERRANAGTYLSMPVTFPARPRLAAG
ncbi:MAG: cytochrome P450, partial [Hyphomicrobiaceae bacterium]